MWNQLCAFTTSGYFFLFYVWKRLRSHLELNEFLAGSVQSEKKASSIKETEQYQNFVFSIHSTDSTNPSSQNIRPRFWCFLNVLLVTSDFFWSPLPRHLPTVSKLKHPECKRCHKLVRTQTTFDPSNLGPPDFYTSPMWWTFGHTAVRLS